jgi:hypothetical protein
VFPRHIIWPNLSNRPIYLRSRAHGSAFQKYPSRNWISKRYPLAAILGTCGCPKEGYPLGWPMSIPMATLSGHMIILVTGPGHAPVTAALAAGSGRHRGRLFVWPPSWPHVQGAAVAARSGRLILATNLATGTGRRRLKWPLSRPFDQAATMAT